MSVLVDQNYINIISMRLDGFVWVKSNMANCRCPVCGDSSSDVTKKRGYFLVSETGDGYNYFCHKGGESCSSSLGKFIERVFPDVHKNYIRDTYFDKKKHGTEVQKPKKPTAKTVSKTTTKGLFGRKKTVIAENELLNRMSCVADLPDDHFCKRYVVERALPKEVHHLLYYADSFSDQCLSLCEDDPDLKLPNDKRLVIPFFDSQGNLKALQGRALENYEGVIRYLTVKRTHETSKVYGDERVDPSRINLVVEGPIDSLLLPNCRATADADLLTIPDTNGKTIYIPDNQYRERTICDRIERMIERGAKVVLFPPHIKEKDINDMLDPRKGNMSKSELLELIATNVYQGLRAKVRFARLRKC